ncbi:MAG: helix-turn-helix domain-containing protein [Gemmataceae bacterium]|nr:helix-turn-helix domain-containing protein [Gemmataceae bacterium]
MRRLPFVRHLPVGKLRYKYRTCRHPVEKPRWHALWLLARVDAPRNPSEVADVVGLSAVTVRAVLHRWNDHGPDGVADRRKDNGADPKLTARRRAALYAALQERPPDGGLWTGPKVAKYVRDRWRVAGVLADDDPPGGPQRPPEVAFTPAEVAVLDRLAGCPPPASERTIAHYLLAVAKLGGYLVRTKDPPPGNMVVWRGITRLADVLLGAELNTASCG